MSGARPKSESMDFQDLRVECGAVVQYDEAWDDLRFPAQAINPPGGVNDADVETTTGLLLFDAGTTEIAMGVAQMPHAWDEETAINPHIHWQKTTSAAGNVLWRLEYEIVANGGVAGMDYPNVLSNSVVVAGTPDDNTANRVLITSFDEIDMTGFPISSLVLWRLSRIGGDALDTYGADARLIEFDIHYRVNTFGSQGLFTKYERDKLRRI